MTKLQSNDATQWLQQRLDDNPRLPALTRHVLTAMSSGADAAAAWRILGTDDDTVGRVINRVRSALEGAAAEVNRPSVSDERKGIDRVIMLARQLQREIKAVMPGDRCRAFEYELTTDHQPPVPIDFGWHSLRTTGYNTTGYPLAVTDVLDWAIKLAQDHAENLPVRAVSRRGDRPEVQSFVRHLAWQFKREFKEEKRGTIAYITCAIFDLENPLDAAGVEGILKDRPAPFKAPT